MVAQRIREYEVVLVLSPEATEEEMTATMERVEGSIAENGGSVGERASWGLKRLAFPVQRFHEGNYFLTKFSSDPAHIIELNRSLKASEDIIRFLVSKVGG